MDWKDALASLQLSGTLPEGEEPAPQQTDDKPKKLETLHIGIDRRQRHGKTATIIEGFLCDNDTLKSIAKELKQTIGVGGSERDGEILLQGDLRKRAAEILSEKGYKTKISGQ